MYNAAIQTSQKTAVKVNCFDCIFVLFRKLLRKFYFPILFYVYLDMLLYGIQNQFYC